MIEDNNGSTLCNGTWGQGVSLVPPTDGTDNGIAYMRLKRQGDQWTYLLSSDGLSWTPVYQTVQQVWTVAECGAVLRRTGDHLRPGLLFQRCLAHLIKTARPRLPR